MLDRSQQLRDPFNALKESIQREKKENKIMGRKRRGCGGENDG